MAATACVCAHLTASLVDEEDIQPAIWQPDEWALGAHGKPFPDGVETPVGRRFFSLAHTGTLAGAAIADVPVGFDLQQKAPADPGRWERRLPAEERSLWRANPARFWAAKESVLKLTGGGLSDGLCSFVLQAGADGWEAEPPAGKVAVTLLTVQGAWGAVAVYRP